MKNLPQNPSHTSETGDPAAYLSSITERLSAARKLADVKASTIADLVVNGLSPSDELRAEYRRARDEALALYAELDRHLEAELADRAHHRRLTSLGPGLSDRRVTLFGAREALKPRSLG